MDDIIRTRCVDASYVSSLEQQLAAAQARVQELREQLNFACENWTGAKSSGGMRYILNRADDLSALETAKAQARREALLEAAEHADERGYFKDIANFCRCMAKEVK